MLFLVLNVVHKIVYYVKFSMPLNTQNILLKCLKFNINMRYNMSIGDAFTLKLKHLSAKFFKKSAFLMNTQDIINNWKFTMEVFKSDLYVDAMALV